MKGKGQASVARTSQAREAQGEAQGEAQVLNKQN
jgi:hypothetical protein